MLTTLKQNKKQPIDWTAAIWVSGYWLGQGREKIIISESLENVSTYLVLESSNSFFHLKFHEQIMQTTPSLESYQREIPKITPCVFKA